MKALIQRVSEASVEVEGEIVGQIGAGILVLLGVEKGDTEQQADKLLHKISHYRMFYDAEGKMNLNVQQIGGGLLIVSQFTLAAETDKGLRPSFSAAALPADAQHLYAYFIEQARKQNCPVQTGQFAADMKVRLLNDGPVTFWLSA